MGDASIGATSAATAPVPEPLLHVGQKLARQRLALGMEVAKAAAHLRISPRQIEAIEAARWQEFPNPAILRGFVRAYAKFVQCPLDNLFDELPKVEQAPDSLAYTPSVSLVLPGQSQRLVKRRTTWGWLPVLLLLIVLTTLALNYLQLGLWLKKNNPFAKSEISSATAKEKIPLAAVAPLATPKPVAAQTAPSAATVTVENTGTADVVPPPAMAPVMVLNFAQESWVEILQADNAVLVRGLQPADSRLQLEGKAPFYLLLGNATQVQLNYQGAPVDLTRYTNTNNQVARLTLK